MEMSYGIVLPWKIARRSDVGRLGFISFRDQFASSSGTFCRLKK